MRGEWVTAKEAAKVIGCNVGTVYQISEMEVWDVRLVTISRKPYGPPAKTFRRVAVKKYAEQWVTTKEAAAIIECSVSQVHQIAKRKNWEVKLVPRSAPPYGSPFKTFRRTAAKKYAEEKAARKLRSYNKNAHTSEIVNLVKWTDGLKAWPTDDEILEHTSLHYKYPDIVSVLESREARDKEFQWPELSGGDEHDYESVECQEPVGVGASN